MSGLALSGSGQNIRKMKVSELMRYIQQCNHPLIVNFWATTCNPCIKEIPYMQSISNSYQNKQVELLLVSMDAPAAYPDKLMVFARENQITSSIIYPESDTVTGNFYKLMDKSWSGGIPASIFINNHSRYRRFFDRQLTDLQVAYYIKEMIKE